MATLGDNVRLDSPLTHLEEVWARYDAIFDSLTPADWQRKHGKDWLVRDLPYHLYYFDRDVVLATLERGSAVPERVIADTPSTLGGLNAWNAREFDARPNDETPERSVARWREVRDQIRARVAAMDLAALDGPVFVALMGAGWMTARTALGANIAHHWNHLTQLRVYLKRSDPPEGAIVRHTAMAFYMGMVRMMMARADSVTRPFTVTLDFTGPGGGPFSFRLADGSCTLVEEYAEHADLVMTQSPETFVKTFARMHNPMLAMLTGQIKVRGLRNMGTFAKLMPPESDDLALPTNKTKPAHTLASI